MRPAGQRKLRQFSTDLDDECCAWNSALIGKLIRAGLLPDLPATARLYFNMSLSGSPRRNHLYYSSGVVPDGGTQQAGVFFGG